MDNSLIREIKDEARKDKVTSFITKNKKPLLITSAAIFLILVAYFVYDYAKYKNEVAFSKIYHQAIIHEENGEFNKSLTLLKSIYNSDDAPSGVKALASLRYAAASISSNKIDKALEVYEEIAFKRKYDDYLQNLSGLLLAKLIIVNLGDQPNEESAKYAVTRIKRIVNNNKILKLQAQEQLAILYIKVNKNDEARKILESIRSSKDGSTQIKSRVNDLIKLIS